MIISVRFRDSVFQVDTYEPVDISIPLVVNGAQPNAFGVEAASAEACVAGDLVGDTRRGGSCNFERYTLIPHCNGTHTECVGHVTHERIAVIDCLKDTFSAARLTTVDPVPAAETRESYPVALDETDRLITRSSLESAAVAAGLDALIIRTLPNDAGKLTRKYSPEAAPPFFSTEAIEYIVGLGIRHLLVDVPSIDRMNDQGKLSNHRMFWGVEQGSFELNGAVRMNNTITELIYVRPSVGDGDYLLNLQIAPFAADASPSRPVLFPLSARP
jgi:kynurenine formamidase